MALRLVWGSAEARMKNGSQLVSCQVRCAFPAPERSKHIFHSVWWSILLFPQSGWLGGWPAGCCWSAAALSLFVLGPFRCLGRFPVSRHPTRKEIDRQRSCFVHILGRQRSCFVHMSKEEASSNLGSDHAVQFLTSNENQTNCARMM